MNDNNKKIKDDENVEFVLFNSYSFSRLLLIFKFLNNGILLIQVYLNSLIDNRNRNRIMFGLFYGFWKYFFNKKEYFTLILGLDGAGKTTLLEEIKTKYTKTPGLKHIMPTVGLNIGRIIYEDVKLIFWDLGGQVDLRSIWDKYYNSVHAVIYVVDSTDQERMEESKSELEKIMTNPDLRDVPILLFFNKRDLPDAQSTDVLSSAFKTVILNYKSTDVNSRNVQLQPLIANTGQGLNEGMMWLTDNLKKNARVVETE
ncbi:ARF-like protein [Cavenderia fasciculata]|uniref:ARF-like protein n=1 Tax=Cavenderia fasciculata TaxID=261658 RepID=F4QBU4_CACFS|nr:ARF-like protein [Cavenderia fasciculata]EGG14682.1 ARF-like protein [Cavenderia fasciculata]|eukprot:XP_004351190.1 ARF-like protein [Cavenderia fasciculata]